MPKARTEVSFDAAKADRDAALRDARRRLILDGAWKVFVRDGFDGATMRAIAAASGCTTGAIYPLFASKELIYAALLADSLSRLNAAVTQANASAATPHERLRNGAKAFIDYYRNRPDEVALGLYLWNGVRPRGLTHDLDRDLNRRLGETLEQFGSAFANFSARGAADMRRSTAALFAFLIGALVVAQTGRLRTLGSSLDDVVSAHLDMVLSHHAANNRGRR